MKCRRDDSVLLIVDLQDKFLSPIENRETILQRSKFLIECANLLSIPIFVTEQYATKMGETSSSVLQLLENSMRVDKLCFSACGSDGVLEFIKNSNRKQVVIAGIETHICVTQTTLDLIETGYQVFLAADAISCRIPLAHEIALSRIRHAGAIVSHSESVVYEWMQKSGTDEFKRILELVKFYS